MRNEIWVMDDQRAGTTNQSIALAEELRLPYDQKIIKYNFFASIPNIFFSIYPLHVQVNILEQLVAENAPKIIISSGRKLAPLALYLKKKSNNKIKIVQIMRPQVGNPQEIDLIVVPQHDFIRRKSENMVTIMGGLCRLNLQTNPELFNRQYPLAKNFIGVLIGGSSKKYDFPEKDAKELCEILHKVNSNNLTLFITFSRRTPQVVKDVIRDNFQEPHIIYDFEPDYYNPYQDILKHAKYLIATADSISICSEVASTGKPLYIYLPDSFNSKKHRVFAQQLFDLNIARKFDKNLDKLVDYNYTPLAEVRKVAEIVRSDLLSS